MSWQPSQTYSWRGMSCNVRHNLASGVLILGKYNPKREGLSPQEGETRLVYALSTFKPLILNKRWPRGLCAGLLS
jgi:hypothetical protein